MTQGLEQVRRMAQDCGSDLAFVVNHSGGKDSTRMLGFVRKRFLDNPISAASRVASASSQPTPT